MPISGWLQNIQNGRAQTPALRIRIAANAVRLQFHALAYNLANFMRTLALPEAVAHWSLTSLREKLVKIGADLAPCL